ncbi:hypothetical protein [Amphritea sp. HPY]|uniref:hypothetical protein n=1 Tax=Amphritea sp. HPY TaxID=3421652 RepID=UPI003D7D0635
MGDFMYEMKPLVCLFGGVIALILGENIEGALSSLTLFFSGSLVWIHRSHARRKDRRTKKTITYSELTIDWYELKPFIYIAVGFIVPYFYQLSWALLLSTILIWSGSHVLILRIFNRKYAF